jgi:uncharacterized protein (DUF983 family)
MSFTLDPPRRTDRPLFAAMKRGLLGRCPRCGEGRMFCGYLKVNDHCPACGEELHHHLAQDAPPYIVILIVGHVVVGLVMSLEVLTQGVPMWADMIAWPLVALALALALLRPVKGALVAYQWALRMHGFEGGPNALMAKGAMRAPRRR